MTDDSLIPFPTDRIRPARSSKIVFRGLSEARKRSLRQAAEHLQPELAGIELVIDDEPISH